MYGSGLVVCPIGPPCIVVPRIHTSVLGANGGVDSERGPSMWVVHPRFGKRRKEKEKKKAYGTDERVLDTRILPIRH